MLATLLTIHSLTRWFVLISLVYAIYRGYKGWKGNKVFSPYDNTVRHWTATIAHIQLTIGLWLYFFSPTVDYLLHNFSEAIHLREPRFFGMEHNTMMILAIVIISLGSGKAKRKKTDYDKFKTMTVWYTIGLIIILVNIPWSFSPLTSRPDFRMF